MRAKSKSAVPAGDLPANDNAEPGANLSSSQGGQRRRMSNPGHKEPVTKNEYPTTTTKKSGPVANEWRDLIKQRRQ